MYAMRIAALMRRLLRVPSLGDTVLRTVLAKLKLLTKMIQVCACW
jgi:hypothetical protein